MTLTNLYLSDENDPTKLSLEAFFFQSIQNSSEDVVSLANIFSIHSFASIAGGASSLMSSLEHPWRDTGIYETFLSMLR